MRLDKNKLNQQIFRPQRQIDWHMNKLTDKPFFHDNYQFNILLSQCCTDFIFVLDKPFRLVLSLKKDYYFYFIQITANLEIIVWFLTF